MAENSMSHNEQSEEMPNDKCQNLDRFHHFIGKKRTGVFDYKIFTHIKENYSIFVCEHPYIYTGGVYIQDKKGTKIKKIIRGLLYEEFIKSRIINQVYNLIIDAEELQKDFSSLNDYPKSYINFKDCMLDAKTMEKIPHDPKYYSINQIPLNYSDIENAMEGAEIEKFLKFAIPDTDDRKMLLEYGGLCTTPDTRQQKFLMFCGEGGTGKSVVIQLLENMVGRNNVSNVELHDLNRRFFSYAMVGKTLNSCADLRTEAIEDSGMVKKLTGEDWIQVEAKGKDSFMFKNYSKMLFSTNELPLVTGERTNGFYRRLLIIEINKKPDKEDAELLDKLLIELPYFARLSVQALHEMYQRGAITISENSRRSVARMRKDSDVVQAWIEDCCTVGSDLKLYRDTAFESFKMYCEKEERQPLKRNGLFNALRKKQFGEGKDARGARYFCGIAPKYAVKNTVKSAVSNDFAPVPNERLPEIPFEQ